MSLRNKPLKLCAYMHVLFTEFITIDSLKTYLPTLQHYIPCPRTQSTIWTELDQGGTPPFVCRVKSVPLYCLVPLTPITETVSWVCCPMKWQTRKYTNVMFKHILWIGHKHLLYTHGKMVLQKIYNNASVDIITRHHHWHFCDKPKLTSQKSLNIFPLCKMTGYLLHNSCIMYLNDLPDMYTQAQGPQAQGRGVPYQVNTRGYVIQLICTMRPE